jgi:hypothetical protein
VAAWPAAAFLSGWNSRRGPRFRIDPRSVLTEAFNLFNTPNFNNPNATFGTANFGRITSALSMRQMQLGAKILF